MDIGVIGHEVLGPISSGDLPRNPANGKLLTNLWLQVDNLVRMRIDPQIYNNFQEWLNEQARAYRLNTTASADGIRGEIQILNGVSARVHKVRADVEGVIKEDEQARAAETVAFNASIESRKSVRTQIIGDFLTEEFSDKCMFAITSARRIYNWRRGYNLDFRDWVFGNTPFVGFLEYEDNCLSKASLPVQEKFKVVRALANDLKFLVAPSPIGEATTEECGTKIKKLARFTSRECGVLDEWKLDNLDGVTESHRLSEIHWDYAYRFAMYMVLRFPDSLDVLEKAQKEGLLVWDDNGDGENRSAVEYVDEKIIDAICPYGDKTATDDRGSDARKDLLLRTLRKDTRDFAAAQMRERQRLVDELSAPFNPATQPSEEGGMREVQQQVVDLLQELGQSPVCIQLESGESVPIGRIRINTRSSGVAYQVLGFWEDLLGVQTSILQRSLSLNRPSVQPYRDGKWPKSKR